MRARFERIGFGRLGEVQLRLQPAPLEEAIEPPDAVRLHPDDQRNNLRTSSRLKLWTRTTQSQRVHLPEREDRQEREELEATLSVLGEQQHEQRRIRDLRVSLGVWALLQRNGHAPAR